MGREGEIAPPAPTSAGVMLAPPWRTERTCPRRSSRGLAGSSQAHLRGPVRRNHARRPSCAAHPFALAGTPPPRA
eukprot:9394360-Alexandrium_andersonii.AAC.1